MAITALGSLGTANVKSAGADLTFSPSRDVPAGRLIALWVAWDSVFNIAVPDQGSDKVFCQDSVGNIYCNVGARTDTQGPFATGAQSLLFVSQLRVDLATTDVITLGDGGEPLRIAKALSAEEFDIGAGKRWAINRIGWFLSHAQVVGGQPPDMTIPLEYEQEWLVLHALGNEGPDTDSFTWDPLWTEIVGDGTTGGADDSNVAIRGGYQIEIEANAATVDITNDTSDRDITQVLVAICAIDETTFPTTSVLDDFNRADENPLDNGDWDTANTAFGLTFAQIGGNEVSAGGSFWDEVWEGCQEAFLTISQYDGLVGLDITCSGDASVATMEGWLMQWATGRGVLWLCEAGDEGGSVEGYVGAWLSGADGTKIGLKRTYISPTSIVGATRMWLDLGGGWEEIAAIFTSNGEFGSGKAGLMGSVGFVDDFGGGVIDCPAQRGLIPQVMRY